MVCGGIFKQADFYRMHCKHDGNLWHNGVNFFLIWLFMEADYD